MLIDRRLLLLTLGLLTMTGRARAQGNLLDRARGALDQLPRTGGGSSSSAMGNLPVGEVASGLKEALRVGSGRVVKQVSSLGGFDRDAAIRIPLPGPLQRARDLMSRVGLSGMADDLQARMNAAAEKASSKAEPIFWKSIESMTLDDALAIYKGPADAATRYFERQMTPPLTKEFTPVVDNALKDAGAVQSFDAMMSRYQALPLAGEVRTNLTEHTVEGGLKGIFHYLAREEASIRQNPAARTTDLLKKVFG